jgi:hypothetical protein
MNVPEIDYAAQQLIGFWETADESLTLNFIDPKNNFGKRIVQARFKGKIYTFPYQLVPTAVGVVIWPSDFNDPPFYGGKFQIEFIGEDALELGILELIYTMRRLPALPESFFEVG